MIPVKVRDLIPGLAEEIGIPEVDLSNMVSFYYKEVKRTLSSLDHLHVTLRGLGTFSQQGWLLPKKIKDKTITMEMSTKPENIQALREEIDRLKRALDLWNKEEEARKQFREDKKQYYINKLTNNEPQGYTTERLEE